MADKSAVNEAEYSSDAPDLVQLRWVGQSTVGQSTDPTDAPEWIKGVVSDNSHEADYVEGARSIPDVDMEYDPIMVKLNKIKTKHFNRQFEV
jgi:hypothetical protein